MGTVISREFFIYFVMTVPVLAALYFIVISLIIVAQTISLLISSLGFLTHAINFAGPKYRL